MPVRARVNDRASSAPSMSGKLLTVTSGLAPVMVMVKLPVPAAPSLSYTR